MSQQTGLATYGDYSTGTNAQKLAQFRVLLPRLTSRMDLFTKGFFDEMTAAAAAQLIIETDSIGGAMTGYEAAVASLLGVASYTNAATGVSSGGTAPATPFRTAITTRNGIPVGTSNPAAATTDGAARSRSVRYNNTTATATGIALRFMSFGYNANLVPFTAGQIKFRASAEIGGVRYQLTQNGSPDMVCPGNGGWFETDKIPGVSLAPGASVSPRAWVDRRIGNYDFFGFSGHALASLGEYSSFAGFAGTPDNTAAGDAAGINGAAEGVSCWVVGDVPAGTMSALSVDDSTGRGILQNGNPGNNSDFVPVYSGDDRGNAGYWDSAHRAQGVNGLNLSLPSSKATDGGVAGVGWAAADLSLLFAAMSGLKFNIFEIGLGKNELGTTADQLAAAYLTIYNRFSGFLLPGATITCREQTPIAGESGHAVTNTTYAGTTGTDTMAAADIAALAMAYDAGLRVIKKVGANQAGFVSTAQGGFPITARPDTVANTISYTVAGGLTVPTVFGTIQSYFSTGQFQGITNTTNEGYRNDKNARIQAKTMLPGQTKTFLTLGSTQVMFNGNAVWYFDGTRQKATAEGVHDTDFVYSRTTAANQALYA